MGGKWRCACGEKSRSKRAICKWCECKTLQTVLAQRRTFAASNQRRRSSPRSARRWRSAWAP
eukprot:13644202-Alexandrium_andersonii.AAC.1